MAVQKNKTSKQRKHTRAANWKISAPTLSECPNCGELKASHKVCPNCGAYDGKTVVDMSEKKAD